MNFLDLNEIEKIEDRLFDVIKQNYIKQNCEDAHLYYVSVDSVDISYIENNAYATIKIRFGKDANIDCENSWQKEITIDYFNDNLDFIAGQFAQSIVNLRM